MPFWPSHWFLSKEFQNWRTHWWPFFFELWLSLLLVENRDTFQLQSRWKVLLNCCEFNIFHCVRTNFPTHLCLGFSAEKSTHIITVPAQIRDSNTSVLFKIDWLYNECFYDFIKKFLPSTFFTSFILYLIHDTKINRSTQVFQF